MHVEIGGGKAPRHPGYIQVDLVKHPATKHVAPAWKLPFGVCTVQEIFTRHMLEHLDRERVHTSLREWRRVLRPGGIVTAIVPDLAYHARQLLDPHTQSSRLPGRTNLEHAMAGFYGWADGPMQHVWGYIDETLLSLFQGEGYVDCELVEPESEGDLHIIAKKG